MESLCHVTSDGDFEIEMRAHRRGYIDHVAPEATDNIDVAGFVDDDFADPMWRVAVLGGHAQGQDR